MQSPAESIPLSLPFVPFATFCSRLLHSRFIWLNLSDGTLIFQLKTVIPGTGRLRAGDLRLETAHRMFADNVARRNPHLSIENSESTIGSLSPVPQSAAFLPAPVWPVATRTVPEY